MCLEYHRKSANTLNIRNHCYFPIKNPSVENASGKLKYYINKFFLIMKINK